MSDTVRQTEYVKVIAIFYFILAAGVAGISLLILVQGIFFSIEINAYMTSLNKPSAPEVLPAMMLYGVMATMGLLAASVFGFVGWNLYRVQRRMLCFFLSILCLVCFPFGTILSIFSLLLLTRPQVQDLFDQDQVKT